MENYFLSHPFNRYPVLDQCRVAGGKLSGRQAELILGLERLISIIMQSEWPSFLTLYKSRIEHFYVRNQKKLLGHLQEIYCELLEAKPLGAAEVFNWSYNIYEGS